MLLFKPSRLSSAARSALIVAASTTIHVSAISLVELAYLIDKGRFPESSLDILIQLVENPASGIVFAPISPEIAKTVRLISRRSVPDMPDRIISATAVHFKLPLVTADSQIHSSGIAVIW